MNNQALFDRLKARVEITTAGCWRWTGSLHTSTKYRAGHHGLTMYKGRSLSTHRAMWIAVHGSIPKGLCVCHSCDFPACINPQHLWLGTHAQNMADMNRKGRNAMASKTYCANGHEFTPENTYRHKRGRQCRICVRDAGRRRDAKKNNSQSARCSL